MSDLCKIKYVLLLILIIGVFVMPNFFRDTTKNIIDQIKYRETYVTGEIASDNGDGTYDVKINNASSAYKNVETRHPGATFSIGEIVDIGYEYGNKESPKILGSAKKIAQEPKIVEVDYSIPATILRRYALIISSPNEIKVFDMEGTALHTLTTGGWAYSACDITMDADGNSYAETNWNTLRKWDSDGNLLVTHGIENGNSFESLNIGPDGYLYTLEMRSSGYAIAKRNITDLTIIEDAVSIPEGVVYSGGICLDSSGNFYILNSYENKFEKWSGAGVLLAQLDVGSISEYAGFGICGSNVYIVKSTNKIYYVPLDLASYTQWDLPSAIAYALTVADNHLTLSGWDGNGDGATSRYGSDRSLIWTKKLDPITSYAYKAGGYNF